MKFSPKTLAVGFGLLVVVWVVLFGIERKLIESKAQAVQNTRLGPRASGMDEESAAKRERLKRARKLSSVEAEDFLHSVIIPRVNFEDVTLEEALEFLNAEIARQSPESARPELRLDPNFLKTINRRRDGKGEVAQGLDALLGGSGQPVGIEAFRIPELRMLNVSAAIVLREVHGVTSSSSFAYRGDIYVVEDTNELPFHRFYESEELGRVHFDNVRLDQIGRVIRGIVSNHEYYGRKAGVDFWMSDKAHQALLSGDLSLPTIDLDMSDVTMIDVMKTICDMPDMHHGAYGLGDIIYDPMGEYDDYQASLNPFAIKPQPGPFIVPFDEFWGARKPAAKVEAGQ